MSDLESFDSAILYADDVPLNRLHVYLCELGPGLCAECPSQCQFGKRYADALASGELEKATRVKSLILYGGVNVRHEQAYKHALACYNDLQGGMSVSDAVSLYKYASYKSLRLSIWRQLGICLTKSERR